MKIKTEKDVKKLLAIFLSSETDSASNNNVDFVTDTEIVVVKDINKWKLGMNQLVSCNNLSTDKEKVLYLFNIDISSGAKKGFRKDADFKAIQNTCRQNNIAVNFLHNRVIKELVELLENDFASEITEDILGEKNSSVAMIYCYLAETWTALNEYQLGIYYSQKAVDLIGIKERIAEGKKFHLLQLLPFANLGQAYFNLKNFSDAMKWYELYVEYEELLSESLKQNFAAFVPRKELLYCYKELKQYQKEKDLTINLLKLTSRIDHKTNQQIKELREFQSQLKEIGDGPKIIVLKGNLI